MIIDIDYHESDPYSATLHLEGALIQSLASLLANSFILHRVYTANFKQGKSVQIKVFGENQFSLVLEMPRSSQFNKALESLLLSNDFSAYDLLEIYRVEFLPF